MNAKKMAIYLILIIILLGNAKSENSYCQGLDKSNLNRYDISQITWVDNENLIFINQWHEQPKLIRFNLKSQLFDEISLKYLNELVGTNPFDIKMDEKGQTIVVNMFSKRSDSDDYFVFKNKQPYFAKNIKSELDLIAGDKVFNNFNHSLKAICNGVVIIEASIIFWDSNPKEKADCSKKTPKYYEVLLDDHSHYEAGNFFKMIGNNDEADELKSDYVRILPKIFLNHNTNSIFISTDRSVYELCLQKNTIKRLARVKKLNPFKNYDGATINLKKVLQCPFDFRRSNTIRDQHNLFLTLMNEDFHRNRNEFAKHNLYIYNLETTMPAKIIRNIDMFDISSNYIATTSTIIKKNPSLPTTSRIELKILNKHDQTVLYKQIIPQRTMTDEAFPAISPDEKFIVFFKCYDGRESPIIIDTNTFVKD